MQKEINDKDVSGQLTPAKNWRQISQYVSFFVLNEYLCDDKCQFIDIDDNYDNLNSIGLFQ